MGFHAERTAVRDVVSAVKGLSPEQLPPDRGKVEPASEMFRAAASSNKKPEGATHLPALDPGSTHFGSTTVSITWITPLLAATSDVVTFAPSTETLPLQAFTVSSLPFTVLTMPLFTSAAITLPGTTW